MQPMASQQGQTAVEYLGVLLVVAAVIAAIAASDIASTISSALGQQICRVASDDGCEGSEGSANGQSASTERALERDGGAGEATARQQAPSLDLGQTRVASLRAGQPLTLRPAVTDGGAQTCFASTDDPCTPAPGGAYEFAPPEPTPGEEIDRFLSDTASSAEAWLGWLGGSDPSSPFYHPTAEQDRERNLETLDDGLAFLERLNRSSGGPALPGVEFSGPGAEARGDLTNELLGISELRRAIAAAQDDDNLRALGHAGFALPFFRGPTAAREGLEQTAKGVRGIGPGARYPLHPKIQRQLGARGWTTGGIDEAIQSGQQVRAINKATGNPATRYIHPATGQSVVVDDVTGQVIHVGGPGFKYGPGSGDVP